MKLIAAVALLPLSVLAACGTPADDPATIPISGKWVTEAKLMSMSANGMVIDPSKVPNMGEFFAKLDEKKELCGEPEYLDEKQFAEEMGSDKFTNCTFDSTVTQGNRVSEKASCDAVNLPDVTDRVRIAGETLLYPDKVVSDMTLTITGRRPNGEGAIVKVEMRGTMTRVGDC